LIFLNFYTSKQSTLTPTHIDCTIFAKQTMYLQITIPQIQSTINPNQHPHTISSEK